MMKFEIDIARDFSEVPAGRTDKDGEFNGERFRRHVLIPALAAHEFINVRLEGTEGFGSSFLEEAFGGLVRVHGFSKAEIVRRISFSATTSAARKYLRRINQILSERAND